MRKFSEHSLIPFFFRTTILIVENDPKMKSAETLFTQSWLKKLIFQFNSEYISLLSFVDFSIVSEYSVQT
jgi:hypothetical protein